MSNSKFYRVNLSHSTEDINHQRGSSASQLTHDNRLSVFQTPGQEKEYIVSYKEYFTGLASKLESEVKKMNEKFEVKHQAVVWQMSELHSKLNSSTVSQKVLKLESICSLISELDSSGSTKFDLYDLINTQGHHKGAKTSFKYRENTVQMVKTKCSNAIQVRPFIE